MCAPGPRFLGFPRPHRPDCFQSVLRVRPDAVRRLLSQAASSSRELHASTESSVRSPPHTSRCEAPSLGLRCPSSRRQPGANRDGFPRPSLPPSAFLTLLTVSFAPGLVGLFRPTATSRVHLQGFSLSHSRNASSTSRALSPLAPLRCRRLPAGSTSLRPVLRALLHARVRCRYAGV